MDISCFKRAPSAAERCASSSTRAVKEEITGDSRKCEAAVDQVRRAPPSGFSSDDDEPRDKDWEAFASGCHRMRSNRVALATQRSPQTLAARRAKGIRRAAPQNKRRPRAKGASWATRVAWAHEEKRRELIDMRDFEAKRAGRGQFVPASPANGLLNPHRLDASACAPPATDRHNLDLFGESSVNTCSTRPGDWFGLLKRRSSACERVPLRAANARRLRPHQCEGVRFLWDNCFLSAEIAREGGHPGWGCVLCHVCGLGKTCQALSLADAVLCDDAALADHALAVVPVNTTRNWIRECDGWLRPELPRFSLPSGFSAAHTVVREWRDKGGLLVAGYERFRQLVLGGASSKRGSAAWSSTFTRHATASNIENEVDDNVDDEAQAIADLLTRLPGLLILDEAHSLRGGATGLLAALQRVRTRRRVLLTGTPVQNSLAEFFHLIEFARPGYLGDEKLFARLFRDHIESRGSLRQVEEKSTDHRRNGSGPSALERVHVLRDITQGFIHRRDYSCLRAAGLVPDLCDWALFVRLSRGQREEYEERLQRYASSDGASTLFDAFWGLGEVCSAVPGANTKPPGAVCSSKVEVCLSVVAMVRARGEKCIIFSQRLSNLSLVGDALTQSLGLQEKIGWMRVDGSDSGPVRQEIIDKFNDDAKAVTLLVSTRAGCLGTNITGANHVILFDVSWNPAQDTQALHRAYRIGQRRSVFVYRLVAHGTMEEQVYRRQLGKREMALCVVDSALVRGGAVGEGASDFFETRFDECPGVPLSAQPHAQRLLRMVPRGQGADKLKKWLVSVETAQQSASDPGECELGLQEGLHAMRRFLEDHSRLAGRKRHKKSRPRGTSSRAKKSRRAVKGGAGLSSTSAAGLLSMELASSWRQ